MHRPIRKGSLRWRFWMFVLDVRDWWYGPPPSSGMMID